MRNRNGSNNKVFVVKALFVFVEKKTRFFILHNPDVSVMKFMMGLNPNKE